MKSLKKKGGLHIQGFQQIIKLFKLYLSFYDHNIDFMILSFVFYIRNDLRLL